MEANMGQMRAEMSAEKQEVVLAQKRETDSVRRELQQKMGQSVPTTIP